MPTILERPPLHYVLEGRTYRYPNEDLPLSDDLLHAWSWYAEQNPPTTCCYDVGRFAWDIRRLAADESRGREFLEPLLQSWRESADFDEVWAAADRERSEDDALVQNEICTLHHRGNLFDLLPDDDYALLKELRALTVRFDLDHADFLEEVAGPETMIEDQGFVGYDVREEVARLRNTDRKAAMTVKNDVVSEIARKAGAKTSLVNTQQIIAALGQPVLDGFLAGTTDASSRAGKSIKLPDVLADHPLYESLNTAIERIIATAEHAPKQFRQGRVLPVLAVLYSVHMSVCESVHNHIIALGCVFAPGPFDSAVKNFEGKVRAEINTVAGFALDSKGRPAGDNSDNVYVFIRQHGKALRYNGWRQREEISDATADNWEHLSDDVRNGLLVDAENSQFDFHPSEGRFRRALTKSAHENSYDPLLDRIDGCVAAWDRVPRLDTWLHRTCGVPADAYHKAVGRNLIGGMVRRARHPGCKHDECVLFISPEQGTGKSTLTRILALEDDWHTDTIKLGGRKVDIIPEMRGKLIIELSELAGMSKAEIEDVKQFISTQKDNATLKYDREASEPRRRCVFVGTSNNPRPLADATGGRRFLPVHVHGEIDLEWLRANVEQLIGEAASLETEGESFGIPRELWAVAGEHQEAARQGTIVEERLHDLLAAHEAANCQVSSKDVLDALMFYGIRDNKIGAAMRARCFSLNSHSRMWRTKTALAQPEFTLTLRLEQTMHGVEFKRPIAKPPH